MTYVKGGQAPPAGYFRTGAQYTKRAVGLANQSHTARPVQLTSVVAGQSPFKNLKRKLKGLFQVILVFIDDFLTGVPQDNP